MDIITLLKRYHTRARSLLEGVARKPLSSGPEAGVALARMREEWEILSQVEEKFLYPRLEAEPHARKLTLLATEAHARIRSLLRELGSGADDPKALSARLKALGEAVEELESQGEELLLREARGLLSREEAEEIGRDVEDFHQGLRASLRMMRSPEGPGST